MFCSCFSDGIHLENTNGNSNIFVSGSFDNDNFQATSLTLLVTLEKEVSYGCRIDFVQRGGRVGFLERRVNNSFAGLINNVKKV